MSNEAERKVIRDQIGTGQQRQQPGGDEQQRVDDQPPAMLLEVRAHVALHDRHDARFLDVRRMNGGGACQPPQVPQQPLLGNRLGNRAAEARVDPRDQASWRLGGFLMALALNRRERLAKALDEPSEEAAIVFGGFAGRILFGDFAVQLVPVLGNRNEEHVHAPSSYDSTALWRRRGVAIIRAWSSLPCRSLRL